MEEFNASELDFMGIFKVRDVDGIEGLVSKVDGSDYYLSRNFDYYGKKLISSCNKKRKFLSRLLPLGGKKGFIIAENMANLSAKVLHSELTNGGDIEAAKACFDEDVANIVSVMDGNLAKKTAFDLPQSSEKIARRPVEQDNKKILKMVVSSLPKHEHIITPGLGGIYIGAFDKAINGIDYDMMDYSSYDKKDRHLTQEQLKLSKFIDPKIIKKLPQEIILFDDNVATGNTLQRMKRLLEQEGISVKTGATQFFWELYDMMRSYAGKETDNVFKVGDFDFVSAFTYKPINNRVVRQLKINNGGYHLQAAELGFHNDESTDDLSMMRKGLEIMSKHGIDLSVKSSGIKDSAVDFNNKLQKEVLLNS